MTCKARSSIPAVTFTSSPPGSRGKINPLIGLATLAPQKGCSAPNQNVDLRRARGIERWWVECS